MEPTAISGKQLKAFRLSQKMTQPECAKFLTKHTGESIDSQMVCRMENYGEGDAYHPIRPSRAVADLVNESSVKKSPRTVESRHKRPQPTEVRALSMTEEQKETLKKVVGRYKERRVLDTPGETAMEIITNLEAEIRNLEQELIGDTAKDRTEALQRLEAIKLEEANIEAELKPIQILLKPLEGAHIKLLEIIEV